MAEVGDLRRTKRLIHISRAAAANPSRSFPRMFQKDKELEACYRFLNSGRVTMDRLLRPHFEATASKAARHHGRIIIAHDTTELLFGGESERDGVGWTQQSQQGFLAHVSLAVGVGSRSLCPLGVVAAETFHRTGLKRGALTPRQRLENPGKESQRWLDSVKFSDVLLQNEGISATHVMDREGDSWANMAGMRARNISFIVRSRRDRKTVDETGQITKTSHFRDFSKCTIEREVYISRRKTSKNQNSNKKHPPRSGRLASLKICAASVCLPCPSALSKEYPHELKINVVYVSETNAPDGEDPVCWTLLTSEPIIDGKALEKIVDGYRARWLVEEYFKALKTGCSIEKRQLESKHAIKNALALFVPIAVAILQLRWLERSDERHQNASIIVSKTQVAAMTSLRPDEAKKWKDIKNPTIAEFMLAVACCGGFIKNNRIVGWQVLGRGWISFLHFYSGWLAKEAELAKKCDQS